jgi:hypothetical protein
LQQPGLGSSAGISEEVSMADNTKGGDPGRKQPAIDQANRPTAMDFDAEISKLTVRDLSSLVSAHVEVLKAEKEISKAEKEVLKGEKEKEHFKPEKEKEALKGEKEKEHFKPEKEKERLKPEKEKEFFKPEKEKRV